MEYQRLARAAAHEGAKALYAERLRRSGATTLMLSSAWVPEPVSKRITAATLRKRAFYEILLERGIRFGRVIQEFSAEPADAARAALLQTELSAPLIRFTRLVHDTESRPVQHLTAYLLPERSRILMDISGDAMNTLSGGHIDHAAKFARSARRAG